MDLGSAEPGQFDAAVDTVGGPVGGLAIQAVRNAGIVAGTAGFPEGAGQDGRVQIVNVLSGDNAAMLQQIAEAAGRGDLTIPVTRTFPLEELAAAYELLTTRPAGRIVMSR